jgi:hypothetical protein
MGIKDYLKHLKQEYIYGIVEYDHVYIDCNYLVHFLIYKCKNDNDLYVKITNFLEDLLSSIKIKQTIQLVYDGEYDDDNNSSNPKLKTQIIRHKNKIISDDYDKQTIKPGTKILNTFKYFLVDVIEKYKKINKAKFKIVINSDEIKGEADIKILNSIYNSNQDKICICSKDSDMILIAQSLSINKSIKIDVISNFKPIQIIYIDNFKKYNLDYVLIVLLLGNDYLPKISSITYESIINTYEKYNKYNKQIISNNNVNYENLIEYITYFIISESKKKIKFNFNNFDPNRFEIYINNLLWCLKYYKVIDNDLKYIQEITNLDEKIKLKNTINICNFINHNYE